MWKFFKNHSELILAGLTVIFLVIMVAYFFWGIGTLFANLNRSLNAGNAEKVPVGFNLKGAAGLDLRGLVK